MEDSEILELFRNRSEQALEVTERRYGRYVRAIAVNILQNDADAEETVNDTLLKAWNTIPPASPESLASYLGMLCRQIAIDRVRHDRCRKRDAGETLAVEELEECLTDPDSGNPVDALALRDALDRFLRSLPRETRIVFVQRYWYCSSIENIAENLSMGQSRVKMLLLRTRKKLRTFLEKEGYQP